MEGARRFRAMGTDWWVFADRLELLEDAEARVHAAEGRLSRFRRDSALSRLNRDREVRDPILARVVAAGLDLRRRTRGAFEPGVGGALVSLGYDRDFARIGEGTIRSRPVDNSLAGAVVDGDTVRLLGDGALDLGGVAKGWTVDRVHDGLIEAGARRVLVDGGGDLRGSGGPWSIGVGARGSATLDGEGIATSSVRHRAWAGPSGTRLHHLIDPATGRPSSRTVATATVIAPDATTADALATALVVAPERVAPILGELRARAWVVDRTGREWVSDEWREDP